MLFGGNLTKQPAFIHLARNRPDAFRSIDQLSGADSLMQTALFLGTYPGLSAAMIEYIGEKITKFAQNDYAKRMS